MSLSSRLLRGRYLQISVWLCAAAAWLLLLYLTYRAATRYAEFPTPGRKSTLLTVAPSLMVLSVLGLRGLRRRLYWEVFLLAGGFAGMMTFLSFSVASLQTTFNIRDSAGHFLLGLLGVVAYRLALPPFTTWGWRDSAGAVGCTLTVAVAWEVKELQLTPFSVYGGMDVSYDILLALAASGLLAVLLVRLPRSSLTVSS